IWRSEETSSEWAPELDTEKRRRVEQEREFWRPDKRNPGFGLRCRGEKSRRFYPPELDNTEMRRRPAHERQVLEERQDQVAL
uniref:hypothetical protein n=1 Tax=Shouchella shacheensis TaxID=1649580 RepID=UPI0007402635